MAHAIIDGIIDTDKTRGWIPGAKHGEKLGPDAIADAYWGLHAQADTALTQELDLRPFLEKF